MKIVLFVHCFFPDSFYGTETYTLELAQNLRSMGQDVTVVSAIFNGRPMRPDLITRYDYFGIPVVAIDKNHVPHRNFRETYHQVAMRPILEGVLDELKPDLVHVTHLANHTATLLDILAERDIPAIATLTDFYGICHTSRLEAADGTLCSGPNLTGENCLTCALRQTGVHRASHLVYRWLASPKTAALAARTLMHWHPGWLGEAVTDILARPAVMAERYAHFRAVIAPTDFLAAAYRSNGLSVPIYKMHFGVDIDRSPKPIPPEGTALRIGFIGQLSAHKGPDLLIDALRGLPLGSATLTIYGSSTDTSYEAKLRRSASGLPVSFAGTFPSASMASIMAGFDCLVIPSRWYENSPLVLLNALACHTPVLIADVAGMTEFIAPNKNGYSFPCGDRMALSSLLARLVADPQQIRHLFKKTEYLRTTRHMTEDILHLYRVILKHA